MGNFKRYQGNALEFTRSGAAAATISAIAQSGTRFGATQGGTPTSLTLSRISQFQDSIKRAGNPVGNLTGGSVTYSNNLEKIETIRDDGLIEGADPTIAAPTGRIDVRFADTTLIDLAAGGTPVDLEFAYTLSAQAKLVLTAHEVYLPKPKLAVEGPGGVQASFDFRGARIRLPSVPFPGAFSVGIARNRPCLLRITAPSKARMICGALV
jgi:hypothetical protein